MTRKFRIRKINILVGESAEIDFLDKEKLKINRIESEDGCKACSLFKSSVCELVVCDNKTIYKND